MSLNPTMRLSPRNPLVQVYDGGTMVSRGYFYMHGGFTGAYPPYTLESCYNDDSLIVYNGRTWQNNLNEGTDFWYSYCGFGLGIYLRTATWGVDRQALVVIDVETKTSIQDIQVFVGSTLVREETIDGRENIAILYDLVDNTTIIIRPKTFSKMLAFYGANIFVI